MMLKMSSHIQNSHTESINELEPRSEYEQGETSSENRRRQGEPTTDAPVGDGAKGLPGDRRLRPGRRDQLVGAI